MNKTDSFWTSWWTRRRRNILICLEKWLVSSIQLKGIEDIAHQFPYIRGVSRREYIAEAFRSPWKMEQINRLEVAEDLQEDVHWHFCDESKMAPLSFHPTLLHFFHSVPVILLNNLDTIWGLLLLSWSLLRHWRHCWSWCHFGRETRRFAGGHWIASDTDLWLRNRKEVWFHQWHNGYNLTPPSRARVLTATMYTTKFVCKIFCSHSGPFMNFYCLPAHLQPYTWRRSSIRECTIPGVQPQHFHRIDIPSKV